MPISRSADATESEACTKFSGISVARSPRIVPGSAFAGPGFARLSYACGMEDIDRGLARIARFVAAID